ncbi:MULTISPECIES: AAA family ATPase [Pseudomonas]|uniref:AAA family ATPase n=1 Tax=Pseudomonas TaxID=286 RepID=UPI00062B2313|nr:MULTISPECIES: AAA family ATPase [Pseudomonas]MDD0997868.1 AAA family ATPase [Pseudomonas sp. TNT2022 ID1044]
MSKILDFEIKNYKGIVSTRVELAGRLDNPVVTLIGLNESGKTTILEAISQFVSSDRSVSRLYFFSPENKDQFTFIPASKKGAFTGTVSIAATVELEAHDLESIRALVGRAGLEVDTEALAKPFKIAREFSFENSEPKSRIASLGFDFRVRPVGEGEFEVYAQPDDEYENLWKRTADLIEASIPKVAYFPTFLINVPEQISLASNDHEGYEKRHYREIVERIIKFAGYDVDRDVSRPIEAYRAANGADWYEKFQRSAAKGQIDNVFQQVSNALSAEVIGGWRRVLSRNATAKRVDLKWTVGGVDNPTAVVSFVVSNRDTTYKIAERSIGFRWFFTFLLLTGFKLERENQHKIYVFDEPAANLHSRAQAELLGYFEKMAASGDKIIYSTHSHHMVNPKWLSGAYIIENRPAGQGDDEDYDLDFTPAEVNAIKYKQYLNSFPTRTHYFQPVVDRLQYVVPEIVGTSPCVILEGISDYYALKAAALRSGGKLGFNLIPAVGSSASGNLISLLMGRGEQFIVLLDDDKEGRKARDRYRQKWILSDQVVITLSDIDASFDGMALEALVGQDSLEVAQRSLGLESTPSKDHYGLILAEHYYRADTSVEIFSPQGLENLHTVLTFLKKRISTLAS